MDAGPSALVEANQRSACGHGELLERDHFLAVDLAQRAAEDGAVLGEDADLAAVDGAEAGDDAVGDGTLGEHAEIVGAVARELAGFDEGVFIEEVIQPLARGHPPGGPDLLVGCAAQRRLRFLAAGEQIGDLVCRRAGRRGEPLDRFVRRNRHTAHNNAGW